MAEKIKRVAVYTVPVGCQERGRIQKDIGGGRSPETHACALYADCTGRAEGLLEPVEVILILTSIKMK